MSSAQRLVDNCLVARWVVSLMPSTCGSMMPSAELIKPLAVITSSNRDSIAGACNRRRSPVHSARAATIAVQPQFETAAVIRTSALLTALISPLSVRRSTKPPGSKGFVGHSTGKS